MRAKLFLLKASCVLLSAFLICGKTAPLAYCQQIVAGIDSAQHQFINGLFIGVQYKTTIITELVDLRKSADKVITDQKKTPEELINYILKKNSILENKDTVPKVTTAQATEEIKNIIAKAISRPDAIQISETTRLEINDPGKPAQEDPMVNVAEEMDPVINKYAEMISVEPEDISNYPLYKFIDNWYGVRYKYGGCSKKGIDCSAFSQKLYGDIYGTDLMRTSKQQHKKCERIKHYEDAGEGDLIFFRIRRLRISHVGVYLANGYFVHASRSHGVMISSLNDRYWLRRYAGCGRIERNDNSSVESDYIP